MNSGSAALARPRRGPSELSAASGVDARHASRRSRADGLVMKLALNGLILLLVCAAFAYLLLDEQLEEPVTFDPLDARAASIAGIEAGQADRAGQGDEASRAGEAALDRGSSKRLENESPRARAASKAIRVEDASEAPTHTLRGRVLTDRGMACAGAEIWWMQNPLKERRAELVGRSDASGRFAIDNAKQGARIFARKRGHSPSLCYSVVADTPATVDLVLGPSGCDLEIALVDELGSALTGITVTELRTIRPAKHEGSMRWTATPAIAVSDERGIVRLDGLATGKFDASVTGKSIARRDLSFDLVAGRRRERVVIVSSGGLSGVLREHNGTAIAHAVVACAGQRTRTDEFGRYELSQVPAGEHVISVRDKHSLLARKRLRIRGRQITNWSPHLDVRPVLHLRFLTPEGKPLPKSEVRLVDRGRRRVVAFFQLAKGQDLRLRRAPVRSVSAWISTHSAAIFDGVFDGLRPSAKRQELRIDAARWPPGRLRIPQEWSGARLVVESKSMEPALRRIGFGRKTALVPAGGETMGMPVGNFVLRMRSGPSGSTRNDLGEIRITPGGLAEVPAPK